jgi:galactokinase
VKPAGAAGSLTVSTPGRVCLFGEHQDYLGLPVIPAAISLRITMHAVHRDGRRVSFTSPISGPKNGFRWKGSSPTGRNGITCAVR